MDRAGTGKGVETGPHYPGSVPTPGPSPVPGYHRFARTVFIEATPNVLLSPVQQERRQMSDDLAETDGCQRGE